MEFPGLDIPRAASFPTVGHLVLPRNGLPRRHEYGWFSDPHAAPGLDIAEEAASRRGRGSKLERREYRGYSFCECSTLASNDFRAVCQTRRWIHSSRQKEARATFCMHFRGLHRFSWFIKITHVFWVAKKLIGYRSFVEADRRPTKTKKIPELILVLMDRWCSLFKDFLLSVWQRSRSPVLRCKGSSKGEHSTIHSIAYLWKGLPVSVNGTGQGFPFFFFPSSWSARLAKRAFVPPQRRRSTFSHCYPDNASSPSDIRSGPYFPSLHLPTSWI